MGKNKYFKRLRKPNGDTGEGVKSPKKNNTEDSEGLAKGPTPASVPVFPGGTGAGGDDDAKKNTSSTTEPTLRSSLDDLSKPTAAHHEHYKDWDPMLGASKSLLNADIGDERNSLGKLLTGVGELSINDVLCPFNDGRLPKGGCYKVSCPYKHVQYSSKVLNELPKLHTVSESNPERITKIDLLPVQRLPTNDCITTVAISTVFHPGNFYVIPEKGWKCLCKGQDITEEEDSAELDCFYTLESLQRALQHHFQKLPFISQHKEPGELVAVRMSTTNDTRTVFRAKVLSGPLSCSDNVDDILKTVNVKLQLLDYGVTVVKSSLDITNLPLEFCRISPLAYKCELFGVSPIIGRWSLLAMEKFKQLVTNHYVLAEVVRTGSPPVFSLGETSCQSCLVNLYVKSQNGDFIDVAQHLIDTGLGIKWNVPKRTWFK